MSINAVKNCKNEADKKIFEISADTFQKEMLSILNNYGDIIDPFIILNQIPPNWFISEESLYSYLTQCIKNNSHVSNKYKIDRSLSEMALIYKEKELSDIKDSFISINNETQCELCKKRIGNTMFAVYPNNKIYHHKCAPNLNICPTTRTDFSKTKIF